MVSYLDSYTQSEFDQKLSVAKVRYSEGANPSENPYAYLLGGQSGAGKTTLHNILGQLLNNDVIVINGDEYRKSHPHFNAIQQQYGMDAPAHTAAWSGAMTEALIDAFSMQHYNLIIEGTLRTSAVPLKTAKLLRERGYGVSLAIMAVKPQISLISCQIRYELMRLAGTTPRATDPEHHNKIINDIADNLSELEQSELFDEVMLYDRGGRCLYPRVSTSSESDGLTDGVSAEEFAPIASAATASETLREVIFGPWTAEESEHYENLRLQLESLKSM